jgi:hypothetical protein
LKRKNLVVIHLESIAWQTLNAFPEAFPNLHRFMPQARAYRSYFASATSTQMVLAYFLHGNDFELDASAGLSAPAGNNPSLFATLEAAGYRTALLCVSALRAKTMLPHFAGSVPPVWATDDFAALLARFEALASARPFAAYVWNLVTHIEHAMALAPHVRGLDELVGGACAVADHALGALLDILDRRGLTDDTTILVYGDHGEDHWTHGFKRGVLHGAEPYTHVVHAPLLIRDPALPPGRDNRLASTIDLAPTCLELLGLPAALPFAESGRSLLADVRRDAAFSQNFTGNQADAPRRDIRRAFSVSDDAHTLLVSARGLALFNHRLDPTNHCNLLHFFEMGASGGLVPSPPDGHTHSHFATAVRPMLERDGGMRDDFERLRRALRQHVGRKRDYIVARATPPVDTLDDAAFDRIDRHGREAFFDRRPKAARRRSWAGRVAKTLLGGRP